MENCFMDFFRAHQAVGTTIPTYFIESTAPDNVDDTSEAKQALPKVLAPIDSDEAVRRIADALVSGMDPNLVVMVHGFNNAGPAVLKMYLAAAEAIQRDKTICSRSGLVCVGYRWPSERMGSPLSGTWKALPTLPTWILYAGMAALLISLLLFYPVLQIASWSRALVASGAVHLITLTGWTLAGLILMAVLLRAIVYFRDNYRASNYGVPDLIQVIRAIDAEIVRQYARRGVTDPPRNVQLSFIGHSMGAFVVTNTIRTLSDVFATPVQALNSYGAGASPDTRPPPPSNEIGTVFMLKRFVLASPDIPAETLLSSRGNFLASALSRFDEAYLFSNEGDEVLRQISTLANYFVFPTKSRNHGFRLGNIEILSRNFGMIDVSGDDFLRVLRIGKLTLQELYDALEDAKARRGSSKQPISEQASLPKVFTYFDCTDYVDSDGHDNAPRPLLTFAKWRKRDDADASLRWYSHLSLLIAYLFKQRPNVHGGYFEGVLSQELIYRLACLGYSGAVAAYGTEAALGQACENKQIRMLVSPNLWNRRISSVAPPAPAVERTRPAPQEGPTALPAPAATGLVVPNLVGMRVAEARAAIADLRRTQAGEAPGRGYAPRLLLLEISREAAGQPAGTVVSQTPAAGAAVHQRMTVEVVVAK
jgi:PASTA domain